MARWPVGATRNFGRRTTSAAGSVTSAVAALVTIQSARSTAISATKQIRHREAEDAGRHRESRERDRSPGAGDRFTYRAVERHAVLRPFPDRLRM